LEVVTSIVTADCRGRLRLRFQENPTSVGSCPVCEVGKLQQDLAAGILGPWGTIHSPVEQLELSPIIHSQVKAKFFGNLHQFTQDSQD